MEIERDYSLSDLENALRSNSSLSVIQIILNNLSEDDFIRGCLLCQDWPQEIRVYALNYLDDLSRESIKRNFATFLEAIAFSSEEIRLLCLSYLRRLSSEELVENLHILFEGLRSRGFFIRFYSEELINSINSKDLKIRQNFILLEYKNDKYPDPDWKRVINSVLVKVLKEFSLLDIYQNRKLIEKLQLSTEKNLREMAILHLLEMIQDDCNLNKPMREIMPRWDFLSECEKIDNDQIKEAVARIKLYLMVNFSTRRKEENISYLINLARSVDKGIRRQSRDLALSILEAWPKESLFKYRNFLIRCQESKNLIVRWRALKLIEKISNYQWSQDIKGLLGWHLSGDGQAKRIVRRILSGLSSAYLHEDALEHFLNGQRSIDPVHRKLTKVLALRIEARDLKKAEALLRAAAYKKQKNVADLAVKLLKKVA